MNQLNILSARLTASKVAVLLALLAGLLLSFTAHPGNTQASTSNFKPGLGKGSADECTSTLAPGGNVQTFANSLSTGEEGCLRGGVYTTPNYISIKSNGGTLAAYPENGPRCAPHST